MRPHERDFNTCLTDSELHVTVIRMENHKAIIGILGGIGSGKSTVANILANNGCAVINADKIAHELLEQNDIKQKIVAAFGSTILTDDHIDRKKLADLVFESGRNTDIINSIIHPEVLKKIDKLIDFFSRDNNIRAIVLDVPLLAEVGWNNKCDKLIFVDSDPETRFKRAALNGLSQDEIKKREKFQISLDIKSNLAHYIVHNNSDLGITADQVIQVLSAIVE